MIELRPTTSISHRLVLALTVMVTALWLLSTAMALVIVHKALDTSLDSALQEVAQRLLTLAANAGAKGGDAAATGEPVDAGLIGEHDEYLTYQVKDAKGRVILRSHDAPAEPFPVALVMGFADTESLRVYTEGTVDRSLFIQVAETHAHRHGPLVKAALALAVPLLLLVPLAALAIRRVVGRCMAPLLAVQREISRRGSGNLTPIGRIDVAAELTPITAAVDRLLEQLEAAFEAERAFTANSAHELRTPLASALAQVQRLRATLSEPAQKERVAGIEQELRRLVGLTEKLLQLSRAESGMAMARTPNATNLLPILQVIVDDVQRGTRGPQGVRLEAEVAELLSHMDVDAFGIVVRNLLENAIHHGAATEPVVVRVEAGERLRIVNAGPVVPVEMLAALTRRFTRGATTAGGAGLGLAIADTILRQCGGRLELSSPAAGRTDGFEAVVDLG